jgi:SNF2 family DNA or RNA helicase
VRVDPSKNFRLIFSLNPDSEIGPVIEPYVVQLNQNDTLSLTYQRVYSHTMKAFAENMDEKDKQLIDLTTEYAIENIAKKFCKKEVRPHEFVARFLDEKLLKDAIRPYVEEKLGKCIKLLHDKPLYLKGKSGNPAHKQLHTEKEEVSVFFHFVKEIDGTRYYPTFRCNGEALSFVNKEVMLVTNKPCLLLSENVLYRFGDELEGKKLTPFFSKWSIEIPKQSEPQYFKKFIAPLIEKHTVIPKGFYIHNVEHKPIACLKMEIGWNNQPQLQLYFDYRKEKIAAAEPRKVYVKLERADDNYTYYKINRDIEAEQEQIQYLLELGLVPAGGSVYVPEEHANSLNPFELVEWINTNRSALESKGFKISQEGINGNYFLGEIKLNFDVKENNDWFDVYATVTFGEYQIPFIRLKKYILNEISEFTLPDGKIAVIPKEWFTRYKDLLSLSGNDENKMLVKKHHYALVDELFPDTGKGAALQKSLYLSYQNINNIDKNLIPERFRSVLRPYQEEGFQWMYFLKSNRFGGVLADDMGLGKTIQALTLLLSEQEQHDEQAEFELPSGQLSLFGDTPPVKVNQVKVKKKTPSLIIMPTSLIHNWQYEVKKWAPSLKVVVYTGIDRDDKVKYFRQADLILTTYGTARNDIELLKNYEFNYIILDESQVIKNPLAKVSKAVKMLRSRYKLGLSGTPVENSLMDLWSQMTFLNPGLLGSYQFFRDEFSIPIEKKGDEERRKKLKAIIQPFILRRTKEQVAKDLPELSEKLYFSEMSAKQQELYDETRNYYRKKILENMEEWGEQRAQFFILKGLMQLRLIANHPRMHDANYDGDSGKFQDIISTLESVLSEKHRVLIFSQFVRHLDLIAAHLNKENIPYAYLTGQTRNREKEIRQFKDSEQQSVFLISLKAGGVGLNLTEADYVFLCDPWWNPAVEQQAVNRAHRIGQDKRVFAYKFISKNTVEEKILMLQERKLQLSSSLIHANQGFDKTLTVHDIELLFS